MKIRVRQKLAVLLLSGGLLLTRCSNQIEAPGTGPDGGTGASPIVALRISPPNDVLVVDLNQAGTRDFTVQAIYEGRPAEDVTARATLASSNPEAGRLSGAQFVSATMATSKVVFTSITATLKTGEKTLTAGANLTVVWLRQSGAAQDFFFVLPYRAAAQQKPLSFSTQIQSLDALFAVDTTASMGPSIRNLRDSLRDTIIPGVARAAARGAWFGVGQIEDFPVEPYGRVLGPQDDQPFWLRSPITDRQDALQGAVNALLSGDLPRGNGGDLPESQIEALYQIATGEGNTRAGVVGVPPYRAGIGGAGFRTGALPVVTVITDAMFHTVGEPQQRCSVTTNTGVTINVTGDYANPVAGAAHTRDQAIAALNKICAKVIGVSVLRTSIMGYQSQPAGICNATADLIRTAVSTGAVVPPQAWDLPMRPPGCPAGRCCTGPGGIGEEPDMNGMCPLVFKLPQDGSGLGVQVTSGIAQVARFASFDVVAGKSGGTQGEQGQRLPLGKTTADFIRGIVPLDAMPPPPPPAIKAPVIRDDRFTGVTPGSTVRFTIEALNDFVQQTEEPQVFHATIQIRAGGCADLDQRTVIILVPPAAPTLG
jgi:hypothetical protein